MTRTFEPPNYTARELCVKVGDEVRLHRFESGWYWATDAGGRGGWIPAKCVEAAGSAA